MSNNINVSEEEYVKLRQNKEKMEQAIDLLTESQKYIENEEFKGIISKFLESRVKL